MKKPLGMRTLSVVLAAAGGLMMSHALLNNPLNAQSACTLSIDKAFQGAADLRALGNEADAEAIEEKAREAEEEEEDELPADPDWFFYTPEGEMSSGAYDAVDGTVPDLANAIDQTPGWDLETSTPEYQLPPVFDPQFKTDEEAGDDTSQLAEEADYLELANALEAANVLANADALATSSTVTTTTEVCPQL